MVTLVFLILAVGSLEAIKPSVIRYFTFTPIEKYVEDKGYPIEEHQLEAEDGFQLTYHRIPHGRQSAPPGHPVLLAHGILQSSALYLAMDNGLAYLLADAGFDVWLMNARGNTYSKSHDRFSENSKEFWDFSFHEMGKLDLPIAIEHILTVSGRPTLSYVGFSMGTTMFWILADSHGSRYMDRVDTMVAIAPIARPSGMALLHKPKTYMALKTALNTYDKLHVYDVRTYHRFEGLFVRVMCSNGKTTRTCAKILSSLVGLFSGSIHQEDTYTATQYMPAGTSVKNVRHFLQIGEKASFQQFDYGEVENKVRYDNATVPPTYDLKKVTCPVFFITSNSDTYAAKEDVDWLADQLPEKPQTLFYELVKDFNHNDYFYNKDVKEVFYKPLVEFLLERIKQHHN